MDGDCGEPGSLRRPTAWRGPTVAEWTVTAASRARCGAPQRGEGPLWLNRRRLRRAGLVAAPHSVARLRRAGLVASSPVARCGMAARHGGVAWRRGMAAWHGGAAWRRGMAARQRRDEAPITRIMPCRAEREGDLRRWPWGRGGTTSSCGAHRQGWRRGVEVCRVKPMSAVDEWAGGQPHGLRGVWLRGPFP